MVLSKTNFRYDIGFLRAIAVVSVLLFHFRVAAFDGGFAGVDVFFVISGFLMTKIILNGFSKQSFSIREFYLKRVQRIIPPLLVVGFAILVVSAVLFFNSDAAQNAKNVFLSSIFVSNIYYWLFNGYFESSSQNNIFLHSWSLSVEWQFYILYPILLMPLKRMYLNRQKSFNFIVVAFTILSFLFCLYITHYDNSFAFYMFPTRAWEMTLGGVAFLYTKKVSENTTYFARKIIAIMGYLLILASVLLIDETMLWPSVYTLVPTFATFAVIVTAIEFGWERWRPLQFFGEISYSLYLWHWPVFVIFNYFGLLEGTLLYLFAISVFLSCLSYYGVERNNLLTRPKVVFVGLGIVTLCSMLMFRFPDNVVSKSFSLYDEKVYKIGNYASQYKKNIHPKQYNSSGCFITIGDQTSDYNKSQCLVIEANKKNVLLLGDSHAAQFSLSLHEQLPKDVHLLELNVGMTFPFMQPKGQESSVALVNQFYEAFLPANSSKLDAVILSLHWPMHKNPIMGYSKQEITDKYLGFLAYFKKLGIPVIIIGQHEGYTIDFTKIVVIHETFSKEALQETIKRYSNKQTSDYAAYIKSISPSEQYIDIYNLPLQKINSSGVPYMVDNNHFSKFGADQVIKLILPRIKTILQEK